jgi:hypothetical protein
MIVIMYQRSLMASCMGVIGALTTRRLLEDLIRHLVLVRVVIRPIVISSVLFQDTPGTPVLDRLGSSRLGSSH